VGVAEENTGVTGAGGRRGALCSTGAVENVATGGGPAGARLDAAWVALPNGTGPRPSETSGLSGVKVVHTSR
jgi:hypothetical protein